MTYELHSPVYGVPMLSPHHGSLGWSSPALLLRPDRTVVIDPGGPGYQAKWDTWLAITGRCRGDVDLVLVTHAHWDHIAAAVWFRRAALGIGAAEMAWAQRAADNDPYLHPGLVAAVAAWPDLRLLEPDEQVEGIRALATPGHTPGHLSYLVPTVDANVLVVGDAVKNGHELTTGDLAMAPDRPAALQSLQRVRSAGAAGARLLLGHDGLFTYAAGVATALRRLTPPGVLA